MLLKDSQAKRNEWPIGLIVNSFPGQDNRFRKVEVSMVKGDSSRVYSRPTPEVVLLLKRDIVVLDIIPGRECVVFSRGLPE